MDDLQAIFKAVSMIFAVSAVATGVQAIVDPVGFSKGFGIALGPSSMDSVGSLKNNKHTDTPKTVTPKTTLNDSQSHRCLAMSYVSLMGVRQLGTGIILLTFAYQNKWTDIATILAIIGIVVAGTDGIYLTRTGTKKLGMFHAIPGAMISALACAFLYWNA